MISSEQNKSLEHKNDDVCRLNLMSELCVPYMSDQLSENGDLQRAMDAVPGHVQTTAKYGKLWRGSLSLTPSDDLDTLHLRSSSCSYQNHFSRLHGRLKCRSRCVQAKICFKPTSITFISQLLLTYVLLSQACLVK
jgi:hypothetical protein